MTKSPPATSDSLFANATLFPAANAANVGPKPIEPVIALSTMSHGIAAISVDALSPSITWISPAALRTASPLSLTPITSTENLRACSKSSCTLAPPALIATTRNLSGCAAITSRA